MKTRLTILISVIVAMLLTVWPVWTAWQAWWPDFVFLVLISWVMKKPHTTSLFLVVLLGLYMDLLTGTLLGQHVLAYVMVSYFIVRFSSRLSFFALSQQLFVVFLFVLANRLIQYWVMKGFGQWNGSGWCWLALVISPLVWLVLQLWFKRLRVV